MKKALLILCVLGIRGISIAQNTFPTPSGNVSIGTTYAGFPLNVNGTIFSIGGSVFVNDGHGLVAADATVHNGVFPHSTSGVIIKTSGSEVSRFTSSGNVGIGTTNPSTRLHLNSQNALNSITPGSNLYGLHIGGITNSDYANGITFGAAGTTEGQAHAGIYVQSSGNYGTKMYFGTTDDYSIGSKTRMLIDYNGNIGVGTINPATKLQVNYQNSINTNSIGKSLYGLHIGGITASDSANGITFGAAGTAEGQAHAGIYVQSSGNYGTKMYFGTTDDYSVGSKPRMIINHYGNVGIGTTTPSEKLSVNGKVRAHEVKVEVTGWPDYVFEDGYELKEFEKLERFIKANKHLPEMPSAAQVKKEGVNLGEMDAKLLKKIEELTLYVIELKKENSEMRRDIKQLKNLNPNQ